MVAECESAAILMLVYRSCKCRSSSSAEQLLAVSNVEDILTTLESCRDFRQAKIEGRSYFQPALTVKHCNSPVACKLHKFPSRY